MRADVQRIFKKTPADKQVMMFSATLPDETKDVCKKFMRKPVEIIVKEEKIVDLFKQINDMKDIPNEIISKYWARAYTLESPFYEEMNDDLRSGKINKYLSYIQMMYEGIKIKSFYFKPKKKLYRGTYFDEKEISIIQNYIHIIQKLSLLKKKKHIIKILILRMIILTI